MIREFRRVWKEQRPENKHNRCEPRRPYRAENVELEGTAELADQVVVCGGTRLLRRRFHVKDRVLGGSLQARIRDRRHPRQC